jgi:hypothetical protein
MRTWILSVSLMLSTLALVACGGGRTGSAAKMPDGSRIAVMVHLDRGITPDMTPDRVTQMNQIASWMEDDLLSILDKTGYAATRVEDPSTPAGPGRYVLKIHLKEYNAGSKAARMLVGFGAGAAKLDTHFELIGDGAVGLVAGDPSVASGRDWTNAARKVNLQTVDTVNAALHKR